MICYYLAIVQCSYHLTPMMLTSDFFDRDPCEVAKDLLGKVIYVKHKDLWLSAQVIETEAYYLEDKGSHASLGYTEKRKALFMPAGTIYMYYARGGDSLNFSCHGEGNAVLIKSGFPYLNDKADLVLKRMQQLNPPKNKPGHRRIEKLCNGQTLLCRSLGLKVPEWDQQTFDPNRFYVADRNYQPTEIIQTTRLGIPTGRDEHLAYRFVDKSKAQYCTKKPPKDARVLS